MSRLADYFVVVGYDHEKGRSGICSGKIFQRFPEKDWEDTPFIDGIELFCQPQGWTLSTVRQESKFVVSVLTDIDANRHYCACLSFNESIAMTPTKQPDDEDGDGADNAFVVAHHSIMYAPKCLVLVSRLDYFETFRNCLGIIYTVYMEGLQVPMETLVGNILGCVQVPPPGGPQVRFSIGASDRQALQPPLSNTLPVTRAAVATLFQQLGIHNSLCLFCAALTEHKILIHSRSYNRLTDACHALVALLHPFKYSHVYIPLLPSLLIEFLSTPTPFIMGIHSSHKSEICDLLDVIVVDLDGGSICIPECVNVPRLPEPLNSLVHDALTMVLHPEILQADNTFPTAQAGPSSANFLDKEIRAIFLRLFAQILQGYRLCLTIIRIHPKPFITFHKAAFLGQRNLIDDEFTTKVLDCMFFNTFVADRGPPYRLCDTFDELYAGMQDMIKAESSNYELMFKNIQELAQQLHQNENPNPQPYVQKIPRPTEGAFTRIHQPTFPTIDSKKVNEIIEEGMSKHNIKPRLQTLRPQLPRIIPVGSPICNLLDGRIGMTNSARRLEVLRNCVNCIFENKISDSKKALPAVLRALKTKSARLALCSELSQHVIGNKAILETQQFDLVVRLMNCALQDDSCMDEHGVAAALLPLATAFCRKLCTGVIQFAYTCIQDHAVWTNQQFWEAAFYQDVQKDIKALYLPGHENNRGTFRESSLSPTNHRDSNELASLWGKDRCLSVPGYPVKRVSGIMRPPEPTALEIAAEQMRTWASLSNEKQNELISTEESTVYSQAIHYANRIVYLRVPLDVSKGGYSSISIEGESNSNSIITNSVGDSDSLGAESGFEEDTSEIGANVIRFVSRFVDKVCTESGVTDDHIKALHQMIPGVVAMHIETLEAVHRESKRLPPIQKPRILEPMILVGEQIAPLKLRVYLIPDGREEGTGGNLGGPALLPAEGAVFITNYRIIFKGSACDPFSCEQVIIRSFPIASLTKEKRVSVQYLAHLDQWLQEGLQLRSSTFQLIKVAFDEEVTSEDIEAFRKYIQHFRNPPSVYELFAFASQTSYTAVPAQKQKEKNATLRGLAKKTLLKTARKAGFKPKPSSRKQKYNLSNMHPSGKSLTIPGRLQGNFPLAEDLTYDRPNSLLEDDSMVEENEVQRPHPTAIPQPLQTDSKTLEKLSSRSYYRDFIRLGLGSLSNSGSANNTASKGRMDPFRMSTINANYTLCRSYPGLLVVPCSVSDDSFRRLGRCHRHGRIPVITWRHPRTKALLLRGSSFYNKGVMGMLKGHPSSASNSNESSASIEQEKLFAAVVNCTPLSSHPHSAWASMTDSSLSINSLTLAAGMPSASGDGLSTLTPEVGRRVNPFSKAMNSLRHSGGRAPRRGATTLHAPGSPTGPHALWELLQRRPSQKFDLAIFMDCARLAIRFIAVEQTLYVHAVARCVQSMQVFTPLSAWSRGGKEGECTRHMTAGFPAFTDFSRWGSLKEKGSLTTIGPELGFSRAIEGDSTLESNVHSFHKAALYVFGDKTQIKWIRPEMSTKCDFIPVEYFEVRQVKASFKKLMRACVASAVVTDPERSFHRAVENSEWLQQLQNILRLAGAIVDLMDVQGSSVMVCLEDGWDITAQLVSVAQVCLDPYYRTLEGFRMLIEKEWLGFGHRFTHRGNQTSATQPSGFAPIFLQFLDVIHQIHNQFPLSFEFNQYYLKFLAYHHMSCRFRTFLLDCESERAETVGFGDEWSSRHRGLDSGSDEEAGFNIKPAGNVNTGQSIWDYIDKYDHKSPVFYNFLYCLDQDNPVLRPYANISNLKIWDYYINEDLAHGPSYDLDLMASIIPPEDDIEELNERIGRSRHRVVVNGCYDDVHRVMQDAFTLLLESAHQAETEVGHLPQKWKILWDKLEPNDSDSLTRQVSINTQMVRSHGRSVHKRSTLEILVRGKMAGEATQVYYHPHRFEKYTYTTPTYCDYCLALLWGLVKTGMRCVDCGYNCHEKCMESVPKNCTRYKSVSDLGTTAATMAKTGSPETASVASSISTMQSSTQYYDQFSSNVAENRTHEGYLYKRGALLKGWKQRWFVLDSIKHQLRYYDAMEDSHCKGFIDLAEVVSVIAAPSTLQGAPKKADDKAFFDLKTTRRIYNFLASDAHAAQEWIEKVQACLQ